MPTFTLQGTTAPGFAPNYLGQQYINTALGIVYFAVGTASSADWKSAGGGVGDALTSGNLSQFAATTSAQLAGVLSDKTGWNTGALAVFSDNPTFTTGIKLPDGTSSLPSIAWTSDNDGSGTGFYRSGTNRVGVSCNGNLTAQFLPGGMEFPSGNQINFGTSVLLNAASNTLSIRNGLNPQTIQIFGTYATAGTDYERLSLGYNGTAFVIQNEAGGTGLAREVVLNSTSALRFQFSGSTKCIIGSGSTQFYQAVSSTASIISSTWLRPGSYTVAGVPSAATAGAGAQIYVSNESGGACFAYSDGTNWKRVRDGVNIS